MGLFTLHTAQLLSSLKFFKLKLDSKSRLTIPVFYVYHCICVLTPTILKLKVKKITIFFMIHNKCVYPSKHVKSMSTILNSHEMI